MSNLYEYSATLANGTEASLSDYKGQVLLVVNTASKCGFTPQYEGLEKLYQDHKDAGFSVLAFPCNQFGHQTNEGDEEFLNTLKYVRPGNNSKNSRARASLLM